MIIFSFTRIAALFRKMSTNKKRGRPKQSLERILHMSKSVHEQDLYDQRIRVMERMKALWLTGEVPCDETAACNSFVCPFSESGDRAREIVVCFAGYRPRLCAAADIDKRGVGTSGRYGYIIGECNAVVQRASEIRRRVGALFHASPARVLTDTHSQAFEQGRLRAVIVFDVELYGG